MDLAEWPPAAAMARLGYPIQLYSPSVNKFVAARRVGELAYVSSVTPRTTDGTELVGEIGTEVSLDKAKHAARWCVANSLGALVSVVEPMDVIGVLDVLVICNTAADFTEHSTVADAASSLFEEVFGAEGHHTRAAIGCASLVRNVAVVLKATYHVSPS